MGDVSMSRRPALAGTAAVAGVVGSGMRPLRGTEIE